MAVAGTKEVIFRYKGVAIVKSLKRIYLFFQLKDEVFCIINAVVCNIIIYFFQIILGFPGQSNLIFLYHI